MRVREVMVVMGVMTRTLREKRVIKYHVSDWKGGREGQGYMNCVLVTMWLEEIGEYRSKRGICW